MEVIATKPGFFGKLRQEGDKFEVPNGAKASWFKPVTAAEAKTPAKKGENADDSLV